MKGIQELVRQISPVIDLNVEALLPLSPRGFASSLTAGAQAFFSLPTLTTDWLLYFRFIHCLRICVLSVLSVLTHDSISCVNNRQGRESSTLRNVRVLCIPGQGTISNPNPNPNPNSNPNPRIDSAEFRQLVSERHTVPISPECTKRT